MATPTTHRISAQKQNSLPDLSTQQTTQTAAWNSREFTYDNQNTSKCNFLSLLPPELLSQHLALYLTPKEVWLARHLDRNSAFVFADHCIWNTFYQARGLKPPQMSRNNENALSRGYVKDIPLWLHLRNKEIKSAIQHAKGYVTDEGKFLRSIYITILTIPALTSLHNYAIKKISRFCIAQKQSVIDFMIEVATKNGFVVSSSTRMLAVKFLSRHANEQRVRQALLAIINPGPIYRHSSLNEEYMIEAVRGLVPYHSDPEIVKEIKKCLLKFGPFAIKSMVDVLITDHDFFNTLLDSLSLRYEDCQIFMQDYLHNENVVGLLLERLSKENSPLTIKVIVHILAPVYHLKSVQSAFCQKLLHSSFQGDYQEDIRNRISGILTHTRLDGEILKEYGQKLSILENQNAVEAILQYNPYVPRDLEKLFSLLLSSNAFEKQAAVAILTPLVAHNSILRETLLKCLDTEECMDTAAKIVHALSSLAELREIRLALINEVAIEWQRVAHPSVDNPAKLAIVKALQPFVDEPEVRQAFLAWLVSDKSFDMKRALIDILAVQLDQADVFNLFIEIAEGKLPSYFKEECQVAAIDKLRPFVEQPKVLETLLHMFKIGSNPVKAACIRALCSNPTNYLLGLDQILLACTQESNEVCEEAVRVLISWSKT